MKRAGHSPGNAVRRRVSALLLALAGSAVRVRLMGTVRDDDGKVRPATDRDSRVYRFDAASGVYRRGQPLGPSVRGPAAPTATTGREVLISRPQIAEGAAGADTIVDKRFWPTRQNREYSCEKICTPVSVY